MTEDQDPNSWDPFGLSDPSSAPAPTRVILRRDVRLANSAKPIGSKRPHLGRVRAHAQAMAAAKAIEPVAPKVRKKHPLSVVTTMLAVAGMFAVAGLPAYATTNSTVEAPAAEARRVVPQTVVVNSSVAALSPLRDGYDATTPEELAQMSRDAERAALNAAYIASGARALGDDYPWPYELARYQGGGLSPLNYFYRECVDFVAWRLNRDAGSYAAPYRFVWSNLTPSGGNASQWKYAWQQHGWPMSNVPVAGAVAWFTGNHVAYVKTVNPDGTVLLEEYNWGNDHEYSQRTIPATSVPMFLYPPPA